MRVVSLLIVFGLSQFLCMAQKKSWEMGDTFPNFSYDGQFARDYQLKDLKGSYVLIHYWASWNEESRKMQLSFIDTYARYKDKKFKQGRKLYVISIALDNNPEIYYLALKKDNLPWKNYYCDFQSWKSSLVELGKIEQIPSNFLLDPRGVILGKNLKKEQLDEILRGL